MSTITIEGLSALDAAALFLAAKPADRKAITELVAARVSTTTRKRWANLHAAMVAGDTLRVTAYASSGTDKSTAWAAVRAAGKPSASKAKPATKAKAKAKAKPVTVTKGAGTPKALDQITAQIAQLDPAAFAAFFNTLAQMRASK